LLELLPTAQLTKVDVIYHVMSIFQSKKSEFIWKGVSSAHCYPVERGQGTSSKKKPQIFLPEDPTRAILSKVEEELSLVLIFLFFYFHSSTHLTLGWLTSL